MNNNLKSENVNKRHKIVVTLTVVIVIILLVVYYFNFIKKDKLDQQDYTNNSVNNTDSNINSNKVDSNKNTGTNYNQGLVAPNTNTAYDKTGAFLMAIKDVTLTTDNKTQVTGTIDRGTIKLGDTVQIIGLNDDIFTTLVEEIEISGQKIDMAVIGSDVNITLKDISNDKVERGQVLAQPNSIVSIKKFEADIYVLSKEEGGRHTPFFDGFRPQFCFRTSDVTGRITLPDEVEMVRPGESMKITVELTLPIAMEVGNEFSIREGGRTVGKGIVTKIN